MQTCTNVPIQVNTINPKSISLQQLFGTFEPQTREWEDGVLCTLMRNALSNDIGERKIINFDGPVEPDWVENLNSVLDDNKVLNLMTGEAIKLAPLTTMLIETTDLRHCSPATISRCAMVHVRDETLPLKSQLNTWLRRCPDILADQKRRIDNRINFFLSNCVSMFCRREKMIYFTGSGEWACATFKRIFEALLNNYKHSRYKEFEDCKNLDEIKIKIEDEQVDPIKYLKYRNEKQKIMRELYGI